ncbi:MAG: alkaline phosphatase [Saprospiraceae bacterium]|nr:alkaline phosphatase [Saprospiraceae bacterium]
MSIRIIVSSIYIFLLFDGCIPTKITNAVLLDPIHGIDSNKVAKNIILLIGDGMGISQISAAMYMSNQKLHLERFKEIGIHKPQAIDNLIIDSASGATAFSIGRKTNNGYIGIDENHEKYETILEEASKKGYMTGMVVTSTIVHATPAAFAAHQTSRNSYEAIALDICNSSCNLLIGGGKKYFDRRTTDSLNLSQILISKGYVVTDYFENDLRQYQFPIVKKLCYFTADGDPLPINQGRDHLAKVSTQSIEFLNRIKPSNGFFLMIEGSQIDWGGHANETDYVVSEMLDFDKAIGAALDFAEKDKNTLVIVTGDHETGGLAINPGSRMGSLLTSYSSKDHSADLIPVFAYGPGAENFKGIYENTAIYYKMRKFLFGE